MKITVIFPSRSRPQSCAEAIRSLYAHASDPQSISVVVALDPDEDIEEYIGACPAQTRFDMAPVRHGYTYLHHYVNRLVAHPTVRQADWLMWFNDDMRMLTQGWDVAVRFNRPAILWPTTNHVPHANICPIWPQAWTNALGRVSPVQHIDTYMQRLGEELGRHDRIPVEIFHDRADVTGNHNDEVYQQGRGLLGSEGMVPGFDPEAMMREVRRDAGVIRNAFFREEVVDIR